MQGKVQVVAGQSRDYLNRVNDFVDKLASGGIESIDSDITLPPRQVKLNSDELVDRFDKHFRSQYKPSSNDLTEKVIDMTYRLLNKDWRQADIDDLGREELYTVDFAPILEDWDVIAKAIKKLYSNHELQIDDEQRAGLEKAINAMKSNPELEAHSAALEDIEYHIRSKYDKKSLLGKLKHKARLLKKKRKDKKKAHT